MFGETRLVCLFFFCPADPFLQFSSSPSEIVLLFLFFFWKINVKEYFVFVTQRTLLGQG